MSALGHKRTLRCLEPMSALPPDSGHVPHNPDVRFVPKAVAYWMFVSAPSKGAPLYLIKSAFVRNHAGVCNGLSGLR
jgi:hypothetical protein